MRLNFSLVVRHFCNSLKIRVFVPTSKNLQLNSIINHLCLTNMSQLQVCCADHLPPVTSTTPRPRPGQKPAVGVVGQATSPRPPQLQSMVVGANHQKVRQLLPIDSCGVSTSNRIVFGKEAVLGQLPWMVRLGYETSELLMSYICNNIS